MELPCSPEILEVIRALSKAKNVQLTEWARRQLDAADRNGRRPLSPEHDAIVESLCNGLKAIGFDVKSYPPRLGHYDIVFWIPAVLRRLTGPEARLFETKFTVPKRMLLADVPAMINHLQRRHRSC